MGTENKDKLEFTITYTFDAPREMVWKAHTNADHLTKWWGPKGFTMFSTQLDLRPGGIFHYGMRSPEGEVMWGRFVYREVKELEKLVFVLSFSDENAGISRHPMGGDLPLEMLSTIIFSEKEGKTSVTLQVIPINATEEERKAFEAELGGMRQGFAGTYQQLTEYLVTID